MKKFMIKNDLHTFFLKIDIKFDNSLCEQEMDTFLIRSHIQHKPNCK